MLSHVALALVLHATASPPAAAASAEAEPTTERDATAPLEPEAAPAPIPAPAPAPAPAEAAPTEDPRQEEAAASAPTEAPATSAPADDPPDPRVLRRRRQEARRGRAMTIAGATLTGLGLVGRLGIDVFLGTVADLDANEPYGRWSVGPFFMATTFSNVPTIAGIGLLGGGLYREARAHGRRFQHPPSARSKRVGWGLLGGGLGLWALSRALFLPWTKACQSNGCAYGYLESSYFLSAGMVITGVAIVARQAGFERAEAYEDANYIEIAGRRRRAPSVTPVVSPTFQGLSLSGRF
ncbi:MAG: hypothetical protein R3A79_18025 [Nannocystaceae bacterium]